MKKPLSLLVFLVVSLFSQAQSPILEQYIQEGLNNNLSLRNEGLRLDQQYESLKEAKSYFLPDVSFNASYTIAKGGRAINFPVGDLLNPAFATLNQIVGENQFPTNVENVDQQFLPDNFHDTKIRVIQPIFNSDIYYQYKAQQELVTVQDAQKEVVEKSLVRQIKNGYYNYLQVLELEKIYDSTRVLLNELLRVNRKLVANQQATKDVIYSAQFELDRLESDAAQATKNRELSKTAFNLLLNRELSAEIEYDAVGELSFLPKSLDEFLESSQGRAEVKQILRAINANAQSVRLNKSSKLPKVSAVADLGFQGFGYNFGDDQDFFLAQFSLTWDIFKGSRKKAQTQRSIIEEDVLKNRLEELRKQVQVQVVDAYYQWQAAQTTLQSRRSAVRNAGEVFKITRRKYENQQSMLVELLDARTKFTNAQLELTIAKYDVLSKYADLEKAAALY